MKSIAWNLYSKYNHKTIRKAENENFIFLVLWLFWKSDHSYFFNLSLTFINSGQNIPMHID